MEYESRNMEFKALDTWGSGAPTIRKGTGLRGAPVMRSCISARSLAEAVCWPWPPTPSLPGGATRQWGTRGGRRCLSHEGSGNAMRRQCLSREGSGLTQGKRRWLNIGKARRRKCLGREGSGLTQGKRRCLAQGKRRWLTGLGEGEAALGHAVQADPARPHVRLVPAIATAEPC